MEDAPWPNPKRRNGSSSRRDADELCGAWHHDVGLTAPLSPVLHNCCRRLAGNLWDAEDLVQDTLLRAFGALGHIHHQIASPRAYLLRTATNL